MTAFRINAYQKNSAWWNIAFLLSFSTLISSCTTSPKALQSSSMGLAYPDADALFHKDPCWLGSDAALSIPLASDRTLWLFGDTFIATSEANTRLESELARNTIAVQKGNDPRTASISFHWKQDSDGSPASFFPENEEIWYWPGHGIRLNKGPLIIFLHAFIKTPGDGLGFANKGYAIAVIDDPDLSPDLWDPRIIDAPQSDFDAVPATAVIQEGEHIIGVAIRQNGTHAGALVRYPISDIAKGDLSSSEWWEGTKKSWVRESAVSKDGPLFVIDDAGSECSIHWDERSKSFIHIASYGFGATTIGMRTASSITGPWSEQKMIYQPPESDGPRPFVYAAKAHPELIGPSTSDLIITYATNSFEFEDLFSPEGSSSLYWPRFVTVQIGE